MISGTFTYAPLDFLHYQIHGSGSRNLVFLHGYAASLHSWDDLIPFFPADQFTLHLIDLKGHGSSSKRGHGDYSARHNARMVADYIRFRTRGPVTLIGHSYGGSVALLVTQEQALVSALILIGTPAFPQKKPPFMRILQLPLIGALLMSAVPARTIARKGLEFAFHRRDLIHERHISRYAAGYRGYRSARALANTVRQMIPADFSKIIESYEKVALPALLIWGEHDRVVTLSMGKKLHEQLPLSQLVVLSNCGHNPHEEQPEAAFGAIHTFLAAQHNPLI